MADPMILHRLSFGNREFAIPDTDAIGDLKQQVLEAVRAGGDYVTIPRPERTSGQLEVLFTPAIPVHWEKVEYSDEDRGDGGVDESEHNYDY
jgi:hypothetical protein